MQQRDRLVWVFNAADFSGNPKWLFEYVRLHRKDITAYWVTGDKVLRSRLRSLGYRAISMSGPASERVQAAAGVFVVNQVKERIPPAMTGVVILNLWHGVGVKRVERGMSGGYLMPRIAMKYIRNNKAYRDSQLFLVSSPAMESHFKEQIDFAPDQVIRAGYPQNTYRRLYGSMRTYANDFRNDTGLSDRTRVVLYAPTFRLADNASFVQRALPDIDALVAVLEANDQLMILKMHPHLELDRSYQELKTRYSDHPRLVFWDPSQDVYEIFSQIDTAVIDYSSIHYDLLAAGVTSFVRYVFDLSDPAALESNVDYESHSCGTLARTFDDLLEVLGQENEVEKEELDRLHDYFWAFDDDESLERIVEHALRYEVKDVKLPTLYSFDIFDTLIHRSTVTPRSIFAAVRQEAEHSDLKFPQTLIGRFVELRASAERAVRESRRKDPANSEGKLYEIQFEDIYLRLASQFDLNDGQVSQLMSWEMKYELASCVPDERNVAQVLELLDARESVILISDMYLPKAFVQQMLASVEPRLAEIPLYLSSEYGVQKSTKELYVRAFLDVRYDYESWVHTGDNPHADKAMAERLAITVNALETPDFFPYEKHLVSEANTYDAHLVAALIRNARESGVAGEDLFAYRTVSLYLVPYVAWVLADAVERGYEVLYFISRDGHHLKRIADAIVAALDLQIDTKYIYGSRRAWRLASQMNGVDNDTFAPHGSFGGVRSFEGLVEMSRMGQDELLSFFPEFADLRRVKRFDAQTAGRIVESLSASQPYRDRLSEIAAEDRELVVDYLRQEIDLEKKIAFAEYWGRGYTQDCLVTLLAQANGSEVDIPFYYARSIYPSNGASIRHNFTSASYSLLLIEAIFANLPYGTTTGYRREIDGRLTAVSASRDYSKPLLEAMEKMLPRFAHDYALLDFIDRDRANRDAFRFGFEHFRAYPTTPQYVDYLAPLHDAVELGSAEREFAPPFGVREFLAYLGGKPMNEITRSLPISLNRAKGLGPLLLKTQRGIGFRRVYKRIWRRATSPWLKYRAARAPKAPRANPPVSQKHGI